LFEAILIVHDAFPKDLSGNPVGYAEIGLHTRSKSAQHEESKRTICSLTPLHLLLQLLELLFCPVDLSLLRGHLLLEFLFLLLSLLNLVADQGATDQAYDSTYAGAYASVACGATDNGPQTCAGTGPDYRALLGRGQR
jgi:hypothetical protein